MRLITDERLTAIIHECGEDWLLRAFGDEAHSLGHVKRVIEQSISSYGHRFAVSRIEVALNEEGILEELEQNQHKVKAFLQAVGASSSAEMLLMVWRILQGDAINSIHVTYLLESTFRIEIELVDQQGQTSAFTSDDIDDAALLRHFGIMKMKDQPCFDGFYAFHE